MRDYKKLDVWKKSHDLYMFTRLNISNKFPQEEKYSLTSQLNRSCLSVPLNIVEGCGRFTDKDFAHFLDNSLGSLNEADYCCFAAIELKYITDEDYLEIDKRINEVRAMLIAFIKYLRN